MGVSTVLWALGILATLLSMAILFRSRPYRGGVITVGTVVQTAAGPVVQFADQHDVVHTVTGAVGRAPAVGGTRLVSYPPSDPGRARVVASRQTIVPIVVFLVVGLGCLVAAVATK